MARAKIAISLDVNTLDRLDELLRQDVYPNRSRAIEAMVREELLRPERGRLARECAKLDPTFETALAEEGMSSS